MTKDERFVILASSLGTVFEWYDFYLFGSLASVIGVQFSTAGGCLASGLCCHAARRLTGPLVRRNRPAADSSQGERIEAFGTSEPPAWVQKAKSLIGRAFTAMLP